MREVITQLNVYPNVNGIDTDENLFSAGVLDSLLLLQFVIGLEEKLHIRIKNNDITYDHFKSFNLIADLLEKYQSNQNNQGHQK
jgi:acyl carrier protein